MPASLRSSQTTTSQRSRRVAPQKTVLPGQSRCLRASTVGVPRPKVRVVAHPLDPNAAHFRVRVARRLEVLAQQPLELVVPHCPYIRSYIRDVKTSAQTSKK